MAPVFPGCHVICRPATYHGIEPPPFLPSLDRRAGIEPALSLLVAGGDPGLPRILTTSPVPDTCAHSVAHHHCAFTNKKKSDPRRMFVGPTGIRSCYPRASTVLHARALSCWPRTLTRSGLRAISRRLLCLPQHANPIRIRDCRPAQAKSSSRYCWCASENSPTRSTPDGWLTSPTYSLSRVTFTPPTLEGGDAVKRTSSWSGWAESNPHPRLGRPVLYH